MTDYRGARGSNTGDDFHELWAARQAIRLLSNEERLEAIALEGLGARDESSASLDAWDGVDCTQYFGGRDAKDADLVRIEQLKYSAANPSRAWTIARLINGTRGHSIIARLAKAWKELATRGATASPAAAVLISNQPVEQEVLSAVQFAAGAPLVVPARKPVATAAPEIRLAYASRLNAGDFQAFASALRFDAGIGSRFALEEQVLQSIAEWTDQDVQRVVTGLRQFVRRLMMPESAGELITRESMLLHLGTSEDIALFPCPSEISPTYAPIGRASVREVTTMLRSGVQNLCLHGQAGVGKTTALQEMEGDLPEGSIMVKYDCYGGGRYLDPSALRHRPQDAFIQLTNDLAVNLNLPLLLTRQQGSDYPRLFANRLGHAAGALAAQRPKALIVIAVDAADNAVAAAQSRIPVEPSFIHDFVRLSGQPENVRFVVTGRTGRLEQLRLPPSYCTKEIGPFSRQETGENVAKVWSAPDSWVEDFHHFSNGVPRIQAYALEIDGAHPSTALDRLMPAGKSLDEVFQQLFQDALNKSGVPAEVAKLCAGLIALPRPAPLSDLAAVLESSEAQLADICADLAPGIRLENDAVSFADEDFEDFVRTKGKGELSNVRERAAEWLLSQADCDRYAALNVANALVAAGRGADLLDLVEREPVPRAVPDPVLRREAELQRLRLAIKVCREAGDVKRALRFVLIGAEGIKTEATLRELLVSNLDLAARFAQETAGRLILSDADRIEDHGPLLFQKLSVDADQLDAISVREGWRSLEAWLQARRHHGQSGKHQQGMWDISTSDISSAVETALKLDGPAASLKQLQGWRPKSIRLEVALTLPYRLIAEEGPGKVEALLADDSLGPLSSLFVLIPLVLAGRPIEINRMVCGLAQLSRRRLALKRFFDSYQNQPNNHAKILDVVLTACEILTLKGTAPVLVDKLLADFLNPEFRRIDRRDATEVLKLDFLFRAYALTEARAGRTPTVKGVFEPRPKPSEKGEEPKRNPAMEQRDRDIMELTQVVFGIYASFANALVNQPSDDELEEDFRNACVGLEKESWRISRQHGFDALRGHAAKNLTVLLAAGYEPQRVKQFAARIHGRWLRGYHVPDELLLARLGLRPELHDSLVEDLAAAADETLTMRIGAGEKSRTLVHFARSMKPLSKPDANAIFNYAVEVGSELDREVMAQIRLFSKLVRHCGHENFLDSRNTARRFSNIVADAAIRLEGEEYFPWEDAMSTLTRLDAPLALANVARWDDETVAALRETLAPVLKTALDERTIKPEQAAALTMFLDYDSNVITEALKQSGQAGCPSFPALAEEAAHDLLIRHVSHSRCEVVRCIEEHGVRGPWSDSLLDLEKFLKDLPSDGETNREYALDLEKKASDPLSAHIWNRETLIRGAVLQDVIQELRDLSRAEKGRLSLHAILESARGVVSSSDRTRHIAALAGLDGLTATDEAVRALLEAISEWWSSPSVREWCKTDLPEVIVARFPELTRYLAHGEDILTTALQLTGVSGARRQELMLRGIERHVDCLGSELIFKLAGMIGCELGQSDAASLVDWYAERLAERIPAENRDQTAPLSVLPRQVDEAVARFVFAYMGDCDLRLRWRAAHAARRLARTGQEATLLALVSEYDRREEPVFRGLDFDFYWLAARLWFVLAWDRIASERPDLGSCAAQTLIQIALDDSFPHLLVRSFARDACEKLVQAGLLTLTAEESSRLKDVNESPLPRIPAATIASRAFAGGFAHSYEGRRFKFDLMDTLPYWYKPMLKSFASMDGELFLQEVERWIIDVWGYSSDIRALSRESRRNRFQDRNWALSSHSHGSRPTLERLHTHLEWHAMWCAAGALLKSEPLASHDQDDWSEQSAVIARDKLVEPPLWSSDLLVSTPLEVRNWREDAGALDDWGLDVRESVHRVGIFPNDVPDNVVVNGSWERRLSDRNERVSVASALVEPATGRSLLRALQTMDDPWGHKLPDEDEDRWEISEGPFRLFGWLRRSDGHGGIDDKDPFRGYASNINSYPGNRVSVACNLTRDAGGRPFWSNSQAERPMFIFEAWGEPDENNEGYQEGIGVAGQRLLAHKDQLLNFLRNQGLDLIIEVEVTRSGRKTRRYSGEENKRSPEGWFVRFYRLESGGDFEIAEGCLGTWTGNSSTA